MIYLLSGENETVVIPLCPSIGAATASPVSASQIQIVVSSEPEMMCLPSVENAIELTLDVCPINILWHFGQLVICSKATCKSCENSAAKILYIIELSGENGSADMYRCGVLCEIMPPNIRTNFWASVTKSKMS